MGSLRKAHAEACRDPLDRCQNPTLGQGVGLSLVEMATGHLARLESCPEDRTCVAVTQWKGEWWWKTLRGLLERPAEPDRRLLGRGHRVPEKPRWDDPLQSHVERSMGDDVPWMWVAQDGEHWSAIESPKC